MTIDFQKLSDKRIILAIVILVFILYGNAINNEYSLDDNIVVDGNELVEEGFKAIPQIFRSRYAVDKKQQYDYRPIVSSTFAIEKQFFKNLPKTQTREEKQKKDKLTQANISHFFNILLYALTCIVLYKVLRQVFQEYSVLLPITVLLIYLVHPLHTEVVSNIKSRDELLMFLFMLLAIRYYIKFAEVNAAKYLVIAPLFVVLSFLSKKNGYAIVGVLPVVMYFKGYNTKKVLIALGTLIMVWACFMLMKKGLITQKGVRDLKYFENPLIFEGGIVQRISVGFYCALFYLKMLIFPYKLSFYYGYNQIPMATFKDWEVWLSILIYIPLAIYGFLLLAKRSVLGLGVILWLGLMLMVVNVLFPIVGIVADRFTYMFSLGFCVVLALLMMKLFKIDGKTTATRIKLPTNYVLLLLTIVVIYSGRTIARNPNWHDYLTLYQNDIEHLENSAKAHALISNTMYPKVLYDARNNPGKQGLKEDVDKIIFHYKEAIRIDSTYETSLNNLGSAYINFYRDYEKGLAYCQQALQLNPNYEEAAANIASAFNGLNQPDSAIHYVLKTLELNPENQGGYTMLTQLLVDQNKVTFGIQKLKEIASTTSKPKYLYLNIGNLYVSQLGNINEAISYFNLAYAEDRSDSRICQYLATLYQQKGDNVKANETLSNCK